MIIVDAFRWLHLPKTGGTSMNHLFRERALAGVSVDPDPTSQKHDSIALRESRGPWRAGQRRHMNLPELPLLPAGTALGDSGNPRWSAWERRMYSP